MRPTIVHLIDDTKLGGVNLALESLASSKLQYLFSFKLIYRQFNFCLFKRYHADAIVVHAAASWRKLPAFLALKLANIGTPILYQEHHYSREFVCHCVQVPSRFALMLKLTYALMNKVLLVSQSQRDWLLELNIVAKNKLALVGQGKELGAFALLPHKPITKPLKLLAYGRLSQQKGFDLLVKAMAKLPPEQVKLSIAGEGEARAELAMLAKGLSHVEFVGEVQDVPQFLASGDLVIIPSRWEPFGLTCIEAIAAGKAVIAANVDGLADQLSALASSPASQAPTEQKTETLHTQASAYILLEELSVTGIETAIKQVINGESLQVTAEQRHGCLQVWHAVLNHWQKLLKSVVTPS
ncbi:glycosyltransferase [Shewanella fidelis]|uniref:glycosyltransferase n=1 Tax=Shewanella fidelis TaxID=173509 RepID=UPI00048E9AA9|nr:glycosyltransferase [Shewanella fidelis]